jgi:DNA-binding NarL/FixJ family response regulator
VDIQLAGMLGIEMCRELVAQGSSTAVIVITAQDDPAALTKAMQIGCAEYFRKQTCKA